MGVIPIFRRPRRAPPPPRDGRVIDLRVAVPLVVRQIGTQRAILTPEEMAHIKSGGRLPSHVRVGLEPTAPMMWRLMGEIVLLGPEFTSPEGRQALAVLRPGTHWLLLLAPMGSAPGEEEYALVPTKWGDGATQGEGDKPTL